MEDRILTRKLHLKTDFSQTNIIDSAEKQSSYLIITKNNKHLKVSPTSYFILQSFHNELTPQEIADSLNHHQNSEISTTKILAAYENLCEKIEQIDNNEISKRQGFWFLWEIISSQTVNRLAQPLSLLFHPIVVVLMLILIFISIGINLKMNIFSNSMGVVQNPGEFWKGYVLFLFSILIHELGHASASIRYGAKPSGIGFTIYLIFPALYSDVTGSWKLKSKQRAIVGAGGMYIQLIVAAFFTLLYLMFSSGSFKVAILMIFGSLLFNINPFFKFDGYWILSDLMGVINLSQQPKRFILFIYHRLRKSETISLPWSNSISICVGIYTILGIFLIGIFIMIYSSYFYVAIRNYPSQVQQFYNKIVYLKNINFSDIHTFFLSTITIFILFYFIYNMMFKPLFKKFQNVIGVSAIIICLSFVGTVLAQNSDNVIDEHYLNVLIEKAQINSRKYTGAFFQDYGHSFKMTTEFEGKAKKLESVYEQYCLNNKSFCRFVLIEKDGVPVSSSKIQKARRKAAKDLEKNDSSEKNQPSGSGILLSPILIDPNAYLKYCKVFSSAEKQVEDRPTISLIFKECNLDNAPAGYKESVSYVSKTDAEISIDKQDATVKIMKVYAKQEFTSSKTQNLPIITMESIKLPTGDWLFKKVQLNATDNEIIFPKIKNNFQYEYFDFKRYTVEINKVEIGQ